jgi:hypothetical protein
VRLGVQKCAQAFEVVRDVMLGATEEVCRMAHRTILLPILHGADMMELELEGDEPPQSLLQGVSAVNPDDVPMIDFEEPLNFQALESEDENDEEAGESSEDDQNFGEDDTEFHGFDDVE